MSAPAVLGRSPNHAYAIYDHNDTIAHLNIFMHSALWFYPKWYTMHLESTLYQFTVCVDPGFVSAMFHQEHIKFTHTCMFIFKKYTL